MKEITTITAEQFDNKGNCHKGNLSFFFEDGRIFAQREIVMYGLLSNPTDTEAERMLAKHLYNQANQGSKPKLHIAYGNTTSDSDVEAAFSVNNDGELIFSVRTGAGYFNGDATLTQEHNFILKL